MKSRCLRLGAVVGLLSAASVSFACGGSTPTAPTPVLTTENFTGTITPLGAKSHTFNVNFAENYSDSSFTLTSLTAVADATPRAITIGVGFGSVSVGVCTRAAQYSNPATPLNTELPTTGGVFIAGQYCISVFDNPAAPTVTEPLNYAITVKHY